MNGIVLGVVTAMAGSLMVAQASEESGLHLAGGGEAGVSGYTVSGISYDVTGDGLVHGVSFTLDGTATVVVARLNDEPAKCSPAGGLVWSCELASGGQPVAGLERLGVVASNR